MPNLRELYVGERFTDKEAKYLSRLNRLEILVAVKSEMTDTGWSRLLPNMPRLRAFFTKDTIPD